MLERIKIRHILFSVIGLTAIVLLFASWKSIDPGEEGFVYRPYGSGIDTTNILSEGMKIIAPWNKLITYDVRQQSAEYSGNFLDKNGMTTIISMSVNFHVTKNQSPFLHLEYGKGYFNTLIDPKVKGTIKDVIGRYTYEEVYSTKREQLASEMTHMLSEDLSNKYISIDFVVIADVDLPKSVKEEIERKETQKQRNQTSELKKREETNLANAKIEKAKGDSAQVVIQASAEALSIKIKQEELRKSPQYIDYIKAERWDGKLPEKYYNNKEGALFSID